MPDVLTLRWRVGRKLGRTVYAILPGGMPAAEDILLGLMESRELAEAVCRDHNSRLEYIKGRT